jgi:hypothetical protein
MNYVPGIVAGVALFVTALFLPSKKKGGPGTPPQTEPGIDPDPTIDLGELDFAFSWAIETTPSALVLKAKEVDWGTIFSTVEGNLVIDVFEPWATARLKAGESVFISPMVDSGEFVISHVPVFGFRRLVVEGAGT